MIRFINLNKEKYCSKDFNIKTIFNFRGYAIQILKTRKDKNEN